MSTSLPPITGGFSPILFAGSAPNNLHKHGNKSSGKKGNGNNRSSVPVRKGSFLDEDSLEALSAGKHQPKGVAGVVKAAMDQARRNVEVDQPQQRSPGKPSNSGPPPKSLKNTARPSPGRKVTSATVPVTQSISQSVVQQPLPQKSSQNNTSNNNSNSNKDMIKKLYEDLKNAANAASQRDYQIYQEQMQKLRPRSPQKVTLEMNETLVAKSIHFPPPPQQAEGSVGIADVPEMIEVPHTESDDMMDEDNRGSLAIEDLTTSLASQTIEAAQGMVIATGVISEGNCNIQYEIRDIMGTCFSVDFMVVPPHIESENKELAVSQTQSETQSQSQPVQSQPQQPQWTVFVPTTIFTQELVRIERILTDKAEYQHLCFWIMMSITLDVRGGQIVGSTFDAAMFEQLVFSAMHKLVDICVIRIQSAMRRYLSNKHVEQLLELQKKAGEGQKLAARRARSRGRKVKRSEAFILSSEQSKRLQIKFTSSFAPPTSKAKLPTNSVAGSKRHSVHYGSHSIAEVNENTDSSDDDHSPKPTKKKYRGYKAPVVGNKPPKGKRGAKRRPSMGGLQDSIQGLSDTSGGNNNMIYHSRFDTTNQIRILRKEISGTLSMFEDEIVSLKSELENQKLSYFYGSAVRPHYSYTPDDGDDGSPSGPQSNRNSRYNPNKVNAENSTTSGLTSRSGGGLRESSVTAMKEDLETMRSRVYELEMQVATQKSALASQQNKAKELLKKAEQDAQIKAEEEATKAKEAAIALMHEELEHQHEEALALEQRIIEIEREREQQLQQEIEQRYKDIEKRFADEVAAMIAMQEKTKGELSEIVQKQAEQLQKLEEEREKERQQLEEMQEAIRQSQEEYSDDDSYSRSYSDGGDEDDMSNLRPVESTSTRYPLPFQYATTKKTPPNDGGIAPRPPGSAKPNTARSAKSGLGRAESARSLRRGRSHKAEMETDETQNATAVPQPQPAQKRGLFGWLFGGKAAPEPVPVQPSVPPSRASEQSRPWKQGEMEFPDEESFVPPPQNRDRDQPREKKSRHHHNHHGSYHSDRVDDHSERESKRERRHRRHGRDKDKAKGETTESSFAGASTESGAVPIVLGSGSGKIPLLVTQADGSVRIESVPTPPGTAQLPTSAGSALSASGALLGTAVLSSAKAMSFKSQSLINALATATNTAFQPLEALTEGQSQSGRMSGHVRALSLPAEAQAQADQALAALMGMPQARGKAATLLFDQEVLEAEQRRIEHEVACKIQRNARWMVLRRRFNRGDPRVVDPQIEALIPLVEMTRTRNVIERALRLAALSKHSVLASKTVSRVLDLLIKFDSFSLSLPLLLPVLLGQCSDLSLANKGLSVFYLLLKRNKAELEASIPLVSALLLRVFDTHYAEVNVCAKVYKCLHRLVEVFALPSPAAPPSVSLPNNNASSASLPGAISLSGRASPVTVNAGTYTPGSRSDKEREKERATVERDKESAKEGERDEDKPNPALQLCTLAIADMLRRGFELHHGTASALEALLKCAVCLSLFPEGQLVLAQCQVCECVLMTLMTHYERPKELVLLCRAVTNLCARNFTPAQDLFSRGIYPHIYVKLLLLVRSAPGHCLIAVVQAITAIAQNNDVVALRLLAAGVAEVVLDCLLHAKEEDVAVMRACVWSLSNLVSVRQMSTRALQQRLLIVFQRCEQLYTGTHAQELAKDARHAMYRLTRTQPRSCTPIMPATYLQDLPDEKERDPSPRERDRESPTREKERDSPRDRESSRDRESEREKDRERGRDRADREREREEKREERKKRAAAGGESRKARPPSIGSASSQSAPAATSSTSMPGLTVTNVGSFFFPNTPAGGNKRGLISSPSASIAEE